MLLQLREDMNQRRTISSHNNEPAYQPLEQSSSLRRTPRDSNDFINPYELNKPEHDDFDDVVPGMTLPSIRRPQSPPGRYISPSESPGSSKQQMSRSSGDGNWLMSPPSGEERHIPRSPPADYRYRVHFTVLVHTATLPVAFSIVKFFSE